MSTVIGDRPASTEAALRPIGDVAAELGLEPDECEPYGKYKAKIRLEVLQRLARRPCRRYIDVTAITPTPLGEGKTVTAIGLGDCQIVNRR